jgi:hypothetical protein
MSAQGDRNATARAFVERVIGGNPNRSREFEVREGSVHNDSQAFRQWQPPTPMDAEALLERMPVAPPPAPAPEQPPEPVAEPVAEVRAAAPVVMPAPAPAPEPCPVCPGQADTIARLQQELASAQADNQALARLLAQMSTLEPGTVQGLHEELERAAVEIASAIIGRAVELDCSWLSQQITQALSAVDNALGAIRVMVNPADFQALEAAWTAAPSAARLVADPNLSRGAFFIDSPAFAVDGGLSRRLHWAPREDKPL